ncbi:hypothetical protein [Bacteroides fragilis]|uniref:hypothetical protein n=1 Tax=Bacteroides fragilis TaxID=817 RepID=UPI00189E677B|nr:hypothetical protein [Bacteroides fragilis]
MTTKEDIQKWIADSVKPMLAKDDGAVYYRRIKGGISFVLAWMRYDSDDIENKFRDEQFTIEASVRKTDSSFFTDDWTYINEGVPLQTPDENDSFATVTDWIFKIALNYLKSKIYYTLPNDKRIELLSEMQTANFDFGDFEEPIADLRKAYYEITDEADTKLIEEKIETQCSAFADFLGTQYEELQSMISISDLSMGMKQALIA